jgi:hypothetical protein
VTDFSQFWTDTDANRQFWNSIYDILHNQLEASEGYRRSFVESHLERPMSGVSEWRFGGTLGFGGKFWVNDGRMYVQCYREDETPRRLADIETANAAIQEALTRAQDTRDKAAD